MGDYFYNKDEEIQEPEDLEKEDSPWKTILTATGIAGGTMAALGYMDHRQRQQQQRMQQIQQQNEHDTNSREAKTTWRASDVGQHWRRHHYIGDGNRQDAKNIAAAMLNPPRQTAVNARMRAYWQNRMDRARYYEENHQVLGNPRPSTPEYGDRLPPVSDRMYEYLKRNPTSWKQSQY